MCGLAFAIGGEKSEALKFAERANRLLAHRGPDGQGIFQQDEIVFAHRRLAILDLSDAGSQPMHSSDGRFVIVYNGEIYNHLLLRKTFLPHISFSGHSDTETLLMLYAHLGEQMLQHMVGMWAFAILDQAEGTVFVSRDRYGQKPLYYRTASDGSLRFSSEIKPLLEDGENPLMNETAVVEYLALGNYGHLGNQTFFKEVFSFKQGHYAKIKLQERTFSEVCYWSLPLVKEKDKMPFSETQQRKLSEIINEAVSSQLLSDVRLGITLSGGIDSSIIAGAITKLCSEAIPTFTAQSKKSKWDETLYVKAVEEKWGKDKLHIHWKELSQTSIVDHLGHYIHVQEEPFGDPSIIAHGFLMAMAKEEQVKVVIGGQGADEFFFGYENMTSALLVQGIRGGKWSWAKDNLKQKKIAKSDLLRIAIGVVCPPMERILRRRARHKRRSFMTEQLRSKVNEESIRLANVSDFYSIWQESVYGVHLPHLLHYDDRNSMSCSLEGRMPFLDHRIAECVAQVKPESFFISGVSKNMLRLACRDLLPESVWKRKDKIGFYTPLQDILRKDILWIEEVLNSFKDIDTFIVPEVWKSDVAFYKGKGESLERGLRLWRILSFVIWIRTFQVNTSKVNSR